MINTIPEIKCNHFFCILGGKNKVATVKVEQTFPNGYVKVTNCCPSDFEAFSVVINYPDNYCEYVVSNLIATKK